MDLRQLAAMAAVADHRSFSAAARALHTVQSNVSSHVAKLERELGVTLFDRATGNLTEEGEIVVARARRVQAELDAVTTDLAAHRGSVTGTVRLGVIGTIGVWLLPLLLPEVARTHPGVHLVVVDATTTSLVPQVLATSLDAALVNLPVTGPDLASEPLLEEDRVLVVPEGHPLARRRRSRIPLAELAGHPLVLEPTGTPFRDDLDVAAARAGVTINPLAEVDGIRALVSLVQSGLGPAVLPATAAALPAAGDAHRMEITGLAPRTVGLITNRRVHPTAPARAVTASLRAVVASAAARQPGTRLLAEPGPDPDRAPPGGGT